MDENERVESDGERIDPPDEPMPEEPMEEQIEEEGQALANPWDGMEAQPGEPPRKPIKGPGAFARVVATVVCLAGLVALIPSVLYASFAMYAVTGLFSEAVNRRQSAMYAYSTLAQSEEQIAGMGLESFFAKGSEAPVLTTGQFGLERYIRVVYTLYGPGALRGDQGGGLWDYYVSLHPRIPRGLRGIQREVDTLNNIITLAMAEVDPLTGEDIEADPARVVVDALDAAFAKDEQAQARKLYYDAIALSQLAIYDVTTDEIGRRVEALKAAPGSERWMYAPVQSMRAVALGEYQDIIALSAAQLKVDREDAQAIGNQLKAYYLSGDRETAFRLAGKYGKITPMALAAKADLYLRDGQYDEATALCDELIGKGAAGKGIDDAEAAAEASATKGVVLLLRDDAEEAQAVLEGAMKQALSTGTAPSMRSCAAALIAAREAGDDEAYDWVSQVMQFQMGADIPQEVVDFEAGDATLESIFTEGWGGFDS